MPTLFGSQPGIAGVYTVDALPAVLTVQGWGANGPVKAALTGFQIAGQGNYQFQQSLRDFIYVYTFGERVGDVAIQGVAFMGRCDSSDGRIGLDDVFDFYNTNRLSVSGQPITVSFGLNTAVQGFLIGFNFQIVDAQTGLGTFNLVMKYPPRK